MTKGTILEVNVSELGLVTTSGKVVWSKYAQVTNNPENDGCVNTVLRTTTLLLNERILTCSGLSVVVSSISGIGGVFSLFGVFPYLSRILLLASTRKSAGLAHYVHVSSILYNICIFRSEIRTWPNLASSSRVYRSTVHYLSPLTATTMSSAQEPAAQITNTLFPPPPEFYKQFTDENVARYEALIENEAGPSRSPRTGSPGRVELGADERHELEGLGGSLQPPRADWIEEEGRWVTFGEMHTVR